MEKWIITFLDDLVAQRSISKNTYQAYRIDLEQFVAYLKKEKIEEFSKISELRIQSYLLYEKKQKKSDASIARSMVSIHSFLRFLLAKRIIKEDPAKHLAIPKVEPAIPKIISYEEMKRLLHAPNQQLMQGKRDCAILELLYATGIRVSELIALKKEDVDLKFGCVVIHGMKQQRVLPLSDMAKKKLSVYMEELESVAPMQCYLFCNRQGQPFTRQGIHRMIKQYASKAGLTTELSLQVIRNSFAVHMLENGADLYSIKELMGVKDVVAVQRYLLRKSKGTFAMYRSTHPRVNDQEE